MAELRVKGTGTIKLFENDNTSSVTIASPASLSADKTITLPDADVTLVSGTMNDATALSGTVPIGSGGTGATTLAGAGLANTPAFLARQNASQTFSDNTYTKIEYSTEVYDTDGGYDPDTNYRFTFPEAGKYFLHCSALIYSGGTGNWGNGALTFYFNGAVATTTAVNFNSGFINNINFTKTIVASFSVDDYVEVYIKCDTVNGSDGSIGAASDNTADNIQGNTFQGFKLI